MRYYETNHCKKYICESGKSEEAGNSEATSKHTGQSANERQSVQPLSTENLSFILKTQFLTEVVNVVSPGGKNK